MPTQTRFGLARDPFSAKLHYWRMAAYGDRCNNRSLDIAGPEVANFRAFMAHRCELAKVVKGEQSPFDAK